MTRIIPGIRANNISGVVFAFNIDSETSICNSPFARILVSSLLLVVERDVSVGVDWFGVVAVFFFLMDVFLAGEAVLFRLAGIMVKGCKIILEMLYCCCICWNRLFWNCIIAVYVGMYLKNFKLIE